MIPKKPAFGLDPDQKPVFGHDHVLTNPRINWSSCSIWFSSQVRKRELTMAAGVKRTKLHSIAVAALVAASLALMTAVDARAQDRGNLADGQAPIAATPQAAPQPPPPTAAPPPDQANRPGFLHQLRVWWDDSIAVFDVRRKEARVGTDDANKKPDGTARGSTDNAKDATKDAADAAKSAAAATGDAMKNAVEVTKGAAATATGAATDAMKGAMEATRNAATAIVRLPNTRVVELHETCARAPNGGADCATAAANGCRAKGFNGGNPLDTRTAEKCDPKPPPQPGQMPGLRCASETVVIRAVCQ
jgi:hypothetical protein